jgi:hypothetical protein
VQHQHEQAGNHGYNGQKEGNRQHHVAGALTLYCITPLKLGRL